MSEAVRDSLRNTAKGTAFVFAGSVVSILLWFASKVLIVRYTTKEEFGIYSMAIAVASILAAIANAGLQDGVTRYISIFLGRDNRDEASAVSKASLQISFVTGIAVTAGLYLFAAPIAERAFYMPALVTPLRVISFSCLFQVLLNVQTGILRGYGFVSQRVYYTNIGQPLYFLVLLGLAFVVKGTMIYIVYAFLFSTVLAHLSLSAYGYKKIGLSPLSLAGGRHGRELLRFSVPLIGVTLMNMIFAWTDTFMIGRYLGAEEVGVYNVSMSLARLLGFTLVALNFVFMPIVGEMYSRNLMDDIRRTYQILTKWVFAATLPLFFILFFFPELTITFLFDQRYAVSAGPLQILSLGFLANVSTGANAMILIVFGMTRQIFAVSLLTTLLNVVLNYIFIKVMGYGIIGAATATLMSMCVNILAIAMLLYLKGGIHPLTAKYVRPVAASAAIGLTIYAAAKALPLTFWMLPIYFLLFVIGYLFSLLITRSIDMEDLDLLEAMSARTGLKLTGVKSLASRFFRK